MYSNSSGMVLENPPNASPLMTPMKGLESLVKASRDHPDHERFTRKNCVRNLET